MTEEDKKKYLKKECPRCKGSGFIMMKRKRSMNQNKYYWSVVIPIMATNIGEDKNMVHEILKYKFNSERKVLADQSIAIIGLSSSELDVNKFEIYLANVRSWAREFLNVIIPLPIQVTEEMVYQIESEYERMYAHLNL